MKKNHYFLCSLPRAGNTLLGTLLNQNNNIAVTAMSILPDILKNVFEITNSETYKIFSDFNSFKNVYNKIHSLYYEKWEASTIIERGPWGTKNNMHLVSFFIEEPKYIILYRPLLECMASFFKIKKPSNKEYMADFFMQEDRMFGENLISIKNILNEKKQHIVIYYDDLVNNPNEVLKKIYSFIGLDFKEHKLKNFKQFEANKISYNDYFLDGFYHTIRTNEIKKNKYTIEDILPKSVINKYSNFDVL